MNTLPFILESEVEDLMATGTDEQPAHLRPLFSEHVMEPVRVPAQGTHADLIIKRVGMNRFLHIPCYDPLCN